MKSVSIPLIREGIFSALLIVLSLILIELLLSLHRKSPTLYHVGQIFKVLSLNFEVHNLIKGTLDHDILSHIKTRSISEAMSQTQCKNKTQSL